VNVSTVMESLVQLIHAVLDPVCLFSLLLAMLLWRTRGHAQMRRMRHSMLAILAMLWALSAPLSVDVVVRYLEQRTLVSADCTMLPNAPIVVLGGGVESPSQGDTLTLRLSAPSLQRALAGIDVARERPRAPLLLSGGGSGPVPEADLMADLVNRMEPLPNRIYRESTSLNTYENARETWQVAQEQELGTSIGLVTSALHMARAAATFRKRGFDVCPMATDYLGTRHSQIVAALPSAEGAMKMRRALRELVGWVYYRLRGWL